MPDDTPNVGEALIDAIRANAVKSQSNAERDGASAALTYAQAAKALGETLQAVGIRAQPRPPPLPCIYRAACVQPSGRCGTRTKRPRAPRRYRAASRSDTAACIA